eukprot:13398109-Alexandrium_andersonii.AAC.1
MQCGGRPLRVAATAVAATVRGGPWTRERRPPLKGAAAAPSAQQDATAGGCSRGGARAPGRPAGQQWARERRPAARNN